MSYCRSRMPAEFYGWTPDQMQAELVALQTKLGDVITGTNINSASYTQGNGMKAITNQQADAEKIQIRITRLLAAINGWPARRAISVRY